MKTELKIKKGLSMEEADKLTTIGHLFETGEVFEKDYKMAFECYTAASSYGNSMAVNNLGWLAQNGFGTKKDIASAVEMYELGVKLNNPISMVNLGNIYEEGLLNGIPDYEKACKYYKMAADLGNQDGLFNYANCLFYGWGMRKNKKKAFEIFFKLVAQGYNEANFYAGLYYHEKKSYDQARFYYRQGALGNDPYCYNQLAVMYSSGLGVKIDKIAAYDYYNHASALGDILAITNMAYMFEVGDLGEADLETAIEFYKLAASYGEEHAIEALNRIGVEADYI